MMDWFGEFWLIKKSLALGFVLLAVLFAALCVVVWLWV